MNDRDYSRLWIEYAVQEDDEYQEDYNWAVEQLNHDLDCRDLLVEMGYTAQGEWPDCYGGCGC